jgi:3-oxoacyl-[acyl-carrier-protein] synthase II
MAPREGQTHSWESLSEPIAITGVGITTCLGAGVEENWRMLRAGRTGLGGITRFDVGDSPVRLGGEAPGAPAAAGEPWPAEALQLERACAEARAMAAAAGRGFPDPSRRGLVVGSSLAGSSTGEAFFGGYLARGAAGADYGLLEGYYVEGQLERLARALGIAGPSVLVSNACAAGASAIAGAARLLAARRADLVVAAGYDPLSVFTFAGFGSLMALARGPTRPFTRGRDGMLLGDGYAALVLERAGDAEAAGRRPAGLLLGCGESTDAHHLTHPHPEGGGAALAMRRALAMAGLSPDDIDYVNCHGTGTRPNDLSETRALRAVFGERLARLPVSSSKPFFGHTLGGAGAVEAVVTVLALQRGFLPATLNLDEPDPDLGALDLVPEGRPAGIRRAMSNSFGFGGSNASLVLARAG